MATYIKTIQPVAMWHEDKELYRIKHFSEERESYFYGGIYNSWLGGEHVDIRLCEAICLFDYEEPFCPHNMDCIICLFVQGRLCQVLHLEVFLCIQPLLLA